MISRRRTIHSDHHRWAVSYADLMTLLAFVFVTLFVSRSSQLKLSVDSTIRNQKAGSTDQTSGADLKSVLNRLQSELAREPNAQVILAIDGRGLVISVVSANFFPSGSSDISPDAVRSVQIIARALDKVSNSIRLEGHTDTRPIHNDRFRSNWELSSARSLTIFHLLEQFGVNTDRISIVGYADKKAGRVSDGAKTDRRVDIVLLSS